MEIIYLVYASTSGNVEKVVETVAEVLQAQGFQTELHRAEKTSIELITQGQSFVLATSTWEHGRLNPFYEKLAEAMTQNRMDGKRAAFIGLGDRRYEPVLFAEGMEKVRQIWLNQGGQELGGRLRIQGEPYDKLETAVKPWAVNLAQLLAAASEDQNHD